MTWNLPQTNHTSLFTSVTTPSIDTEDSTKQWITTTTIETPAKEKWSPIARAVGNTYTVINYAFTGLVTPIRGWLTGRRPASGLQYPRGIYNR